MNYPEEILLETLAKALVTKEDQISITRTVDDIGILLTLKVAPEDMGKVIGRGGMVAQSLRCILRSVGMKNNDKVNLKIAEPQTENLGE